MREETVVITNKVGLHARPAALLVKTAAAHKCDVSIEKNGKAYNAKSMLTVMAAGVRQGDAVIVRASGEGEEAALAAVVELIQSGFGEE